MDTSLFVKRLETAATVEVAEDFTLPDYEPPIQRVVGVRAAPLNEGKYLSGDGLELDGSVTYTVLYMSDSGELVQTSRTSQYTADIAAKSEDDRFSPRDIAVGCTAEGVSCRVTGPRKLALSCRVKHSVMSQKPTDAGLKSEGNGVTVRSKREKCITAAVLEVKKSCEVSGEMREREGMRIVMAQAGIGIYDVRIRSGGKKEADVKGECYVSALLLTPEGEYIVSKGRAPIEETVELPDIRGDGALRGTAMGSVAMLEIEASESGELRWNVEYDIDCDVMRCCECETAADAYLTGMNDRLTFGEFTAYAPACTANGRLTATGSAKMRPGAKYIYAWGSGSADRCDISGGRMIFYGSVKVSLVTSLEGEMTADEVNLPFKYECEAAEGASDASDGDITRRVGVTVTDIGVRTDGDVAGITAELSISCAALARGQVRAVVGIAPTGEESAEETRRSMMRVYVPEQGETPWDVEKRFRLGREISPEGGVYVI